MTAYRQADLNHCWQWREAGGESRGREAGGRQAGCTAVEPQPAFAALLRQEVPMLKALLTPIVLGLAVAMVIRLTRPRRAY